LQGRHAGGMGCSPIWGPSEQPSEGENLSELTKLVSDSILIRLVLAWTVLDCHTGEPRVGKAREKLEGRRASHKITLGFDLRLREFENSSFVRFSTRGGLENLEAPRATKG